MTVEFGRSPKNHLVARFKDRLNRVFSMWVSPVPAGPFLIISRHGLAIHIRQDIVMQLLPFIRRFATTGTMEPKGPETSTIPSVEELAQAICDAGEDWHKSRGPSKYDEFDLHVAKKLRTLLEARA